MRKAVGFVEIKSIPVGIQTADEMVKAGNVELLLATPMCPGKYIIIIGGQVGPVKSANTLMNEAGTSTGYGSGFSYVRQNSPNYGKELAELSR